MEGINFSLSLVLILSSMGNCSFNCSRNSQSIEKFPNLCNHSNSTDGILLKNYISSDKNEKQRAINDSFIINGLSNGKMNNLNSIPNGIKEDVKVDTSNNLNDSNGITEVEHELMVLGQAIQIFHVTNNFLFLNKTKTKEHKVQNTKAQLNRRYNIAFGIISTCALVIGAVGNSAVLIVSYLNRADLSRNKVVIALLALSDGLSSILNFLHTFHVFFTDRWLFGVPLCKVIFTGMMVCSWLSGGFILTITMERFFAVVYSLKRNLQGNKIVFLCVTVNVVLAILAGVPMIITTDVNEDGVCHNYAPHSIMVPYHWCLIVVFVIAPACAVYYLYFRILHYLIIQTRKSVALSREDLKVKRMKDNRRTVKIIVPIIVLFVLCVLPLHAIELYIAYWSTSIKSSAHRFAVYKILGIIQNITFPLHACVNPIIYTIMDRTFRNDLLSILRWQRKAEVQSS